MYTRTVYYVPYGVHLCDFILYHRLVRSHEIVITPCSVYMYFSLQKGQTALIVASHEGHVECVMLLEKGTSADLLDEVSAGSHQLLSVWHVPLCKKGIVEVHWVWLHVCAFTCV